MTPMIWLIRLDEPSIRLIAANGVADNVAGLGSTRPSVSLTISRASAARSEALFTVEVISSSAAAVCFKRGRLLFGAASTGCW